MTIVPATSPEQLRQVRRLLEEYAASLSFDLGFQNFQQELDGLPGDYALPGGGLWLTTTDRGMRRAVSLCGGWSRVSGR